MRFENLASSSAGNCYWLELERGSGQENVKIMFEAGIPYSDMLQKFCRISPAVDMRTLSGVLITHDHADHCKGAKDLKKRGFRIFGNSSVCSSPATLLKDGQIKVIAPDTFVLPFSVEHDAPDPLGYYLWTDKESVLLVADCKFWRADLSRLAPDYIVIESNYDGSILHFALEEAREGGDKGRQAAYERILNAHMSIKNTVDSLNKLDLSKCKAIFLIHLSDRHSRALDFKYKVASATKIKTYICQKNGGIV